MYLLFLPSFIEAYILAIGRLVGTTSQGQAFEIKKGLS